MKVTIFVLMLVSAVAVNAQGNNSGDRRGRSIDDRKEQTPACKYGKPIVGECNGEEYTFVFESDDCPTREGTGKCMVNSEGDMVPVASVFKSLECFYTLPEVSGDCDPETNTLILSHTLLTKDVEGCDQTIESTVQCSENNDGKLVPKLGEMSLFPRRTEFNCLNSEERRGPQSRRSEHFGVKHGENRNRGRNGRGIVGRRYGKGRLPNGGRRGGVRGRRDNE